jgi:MFS family permease
LNVYIELLRANRNYRYLWLARVVSNLGDWFNLLASAALITSLTGAGTAISYLFLARFLPIFVMSPFAGVLADRYERRALMVLSDLLRAVTVLCFLFVRSAEQIWLLYALTVVQFVLSSLYQPAHSAILSNIVAPRDLITANALDSFTWSSMLAFGALLGGIATALFGIQTAFVLDALTFLLAAWFVAQIAAPPVVTPVGEQQPVRLAGHLEFLAGLSYLRARPFILTIALVKAGAALVWGAVSVMEVPLAREIFPFGGDGALSLGLIYAVTGIGTGIGPLLLRRWFGDGYRAMMWAILISFVLLAAGVMGVGYAPTLSWVLGATFLRAFGSGAVWVFSSVLLQSMVDNQYRGRVFAFEFAIMTLTQSISTVWAGLALDYLQMGIQGVFVAASLLALMVTGIWFLCQLRFATHPALT